MSTLQPLFIVGTGRCGSTMLSNLVRRHPDLLSLSELFSLATDLGGRIAMCFPDHPIGADELWRIVAGIPPKLATMRRHDVMMDEVLYRPAAPSRFGSVSGVPTILETTLPHLCDEPEALFDDLERFVSTLPTAAVGQHYQQMFSFLAHRFGKRTWIERSGGSLRLARRLIESFPDARFVHLVRDGRNCAISMSRHLGFRMALIAIQLTEILGVDPWESSDRAYVDDVPEELMPFLPERFDREAFVRYETPLPLCGHYWSGEILTGLDELSGVAPGRLLTLRYEDFGRAPRPTIARLMEFIGVDANDAWIERLAGIVRPARSRFTELEPGERRALTEACQPGFAALAELYSAEVAETAMDGTPT